MRVSFAADPPDTFAEQNGLESERVTPGLTLLDFFDANISGRDFAKGKPRADDEDLLGPAEPDVLVTSLDDVDLDALHEGRRAREGRLAGTR